MAAFEYRPYDSSRWTGSIADIIRAKGDIPAQALLRNAAINADAARQSGQIWGGSVAGIGQQVGGMIQQQNDPRRKLEEIQLKDVQDEHAGKAALTKLQTPTMPNGPMQEGETRTPQNPYMRKEGDTWVWDTSALGEAMAAQGKPLTPTLLKSITDFNETNRQEQAHRDQFAKTQRQLVGQAAGVLAGLLRAHPDTDLNAAGQLIGQQFAANGSFPLDRFNATFQQVAGDPSTALAKLDALARISGEAPIKLGKDDVLLNPNDPSAPPLASNMVPEPNKGDYTINGQRFKADGTPIGTAVAPQHVPVPKSYQKSSMLVDGKPTEVFIDPDPAAKQKVFDLDGNPITNAASRAKPIPPASTQVNLGSVSNVKEAVAGMKEGTIPPQLPGRASKEYVELMAEAHRQGFDLAGAATDWTATQKHIATLNGTQQTKLMQSINSLPELLDSVDTLASKWKGGQFPILNKANLALAKGGAYGVDVASVANQLDAQIADVTSDLGAVYMGGNTPTDHSLDLAKKALSADWDEKVLKDMIKLARNNVQTRKNSINNTGVQGASDGNPYAPKPAVTPAATGRQRVVGPNGETGTVPQGTALPAGWKVQ